MPIGGRKRLTTKAASSDSQLKNVGQALLKLLQEQYKGYTLRYRDAIPDTETIQVLTDIVPDIKDLITVTQNKVRGEPQIEPDGGSIDIKCKDGIWRPLVFSEMKTQQDAGNAIERVFKNARVLEVYSTKYGYFPYIVFGCGEGFRSVKSEALKKFLQGNYFICNRFIPEGIKINTQDKLYPITGYFSHTTFDFNFMWDKLMQMVGYSFVILNENNLI